MERNKLHTLWRAKITLFRKRLKSKCFIHEDDRFQRQEFRTALNNLSVILQPQKKTLQTKAKERVVFGYKNKHGEHKEKVSERTEENESTDCLKYLVLDTCEAFAKCAKQAMTLLQTSRSLLLYKAK